MLNLSLFDFFTSKLVLIITFFVISTVKCNDVWQQDLSKDMQIGVTNTGYEKVSLRCGVNSMQVDLTTEDDFSGVVYTRGSFHKKQSPCYLDPGENNGKVFTLKFPFDKCQTLHDGDVYSNVLVVQHDKELIMPGDSAFTLECDFSSPTDVTVSASLNENRKLAASRITLTDADPAVQNSDKYKRNTVENSSDIVELLPTNIKTQKLLRKDEL